MKKLSLYFSFFAAAVLVIAGCKKVDPLPYYNDGSQVTLTASKTSVAPTPADSLNNVVTFTWTSPNYGTNPNTYKYIVEVDSTGRNFAKSVKKEVTGKQEASFTGKELNAILLNYGFKLGSPTSLDVRVTSSYGNNNEKYVSNPITIKVTAYTDPSVLTTSATTVTGTLNTSTQKSLTFSWSPSFNGYTGTVTYSLQYDSTGKNFASPHEMPFGAGLLKRDMTQAEINTSALDEGVAGGTTGKIDYRIKATTAQGAVAFSNAVSVSVGTYQPILRFYMPGSYQGATGNGTDWTPADAPEFVRDLRPEVLNKLYYMYIYLPANTEFKVTEGRSWDTNYGGDNGNLVLNSSNNLKVTAAGYYRISIDVVNKKYDIREGRMGFVGGATGADWTPGNVFPNYALGMAAKNLFVGLTDFKTGGWKLIDNNAWNDGSNSVAETRSYGSAGGSGSTVEINSSTNMPDVTTAGRYRVIWDGRDVNNVKYEMSPANEMRLVGDGINMAGVNDWDPGSSPQMTYNGNGVWTITAALKANKSIKFLAGNAWGALDYEDQSGSNALGTPRAISWNSGGDNFKTPATAGTYTITLDENKQTVTIN